MAGVRLPVLYGICLGLQLYGCGGGGGGFGGDGGISGRSSAKREAGKDEAPAARANTTTSAETSQAAADISFDSEEDEATLPTQVSGAFLVDCGWLEDDAANERGLGGCRVTRSLDGKTLSGSDISGVKLRLVTQDADESIAVLAGAGVHAFRFPIAYASYGQEIVIDVSFTVLDQSGKIDVHIEAAVADVPDAAPAGESASEQESPAAEPFAFYDIGAFKLGDDGLNKAQQCPSIESAAAAGHYGRQLELAFELKGAGGEVELSFERVCGNGSGGAGSSRRARWSVTDAAGNTKAGNDIAPSATADGAPDGSGAPSTTFSVKLGALPAGSYLFTVYAGIGANGTSLDDSVAANVRIGAPGFVFQGLQFK